jgi:hypothetical protein
LISIKQAFEKVLNMSFSSYIVKLSLFLFIVLIQINFTIPFSNAENEENGIISGSIIVENKAFEGAKVILKEVGNKANQAYRETMTNSEGKYVFENVSLAKAYKLEGIFGETNHTKMISMDNLTQRANFIFNGRLETQVLLPNGTAVGNLQLKLLNNLGLNELNSTTDTMGIGIFELLDVKDTYYVSLVYQRIPYYKEVSFELSNLTKIVIDLLEATTSDRDFEVYNHHVIINGQESELIFWESASYYNMGNKIFNTSWLNGWFPAEAYDITHDSMDCCIQFSDGGDYTFDPMDPLFPGEDYELALSYKLQTTVPKQILEKRIIYDTGKMYYFLQKSPDVTVEALENLEYMGTERFGDTEYLRFEGSNLIAGDLVRLKLSTKVSAVNLILKNQFIWGSIVLGLPLGLMSYLFKTKKESESQGSLEKQQESIFKDLVKAEKDLKKQKITPKEFEKLKSRYKKRSIKILKKINKIETPSLSKKEGAPDLYSELKSVEIVINRITADYENGDLSEKSYKSIVSKYEEKREQLIEKIQILIETDEKKD